MKPHDLYVRALGVHLPAERITVEEAAAAGRCRPGEIAGGDLHSVSVAPAEATGLDMAVRAGRRALERAGQDPADTDLLVHATMLPEGPDGWSSAGYVLRELGCGAGACHEIRQGCNGVFAAIELAAGWLALAPRDATALITTALRADTPILDRWRSAGFGMALGDGACAVLLGRDTGVARVDAVNSMTFPELEGLHRGVTVPSERDVRDRPVIDIAARTREFVAAAGLDVFDLYRTFAAMYAKVITASLEEAGAEPRDLARVIFTNAGEAVTDAAVTRTLGLPVSRATWDFGRTIGHLGASDQIVSLDHLLATGRLAAGDRVLLVGGTQGYNTASAVLTVCGGPAAA